MSNLLSQKRQDFPIVSLYIEEVFFSRNVAHALLLYHKQGQFFFLSNIMTIAIVLKKDKTR